MELIINYIIESAICLGILTLFYKLWLRKNPVLWFNRAYLLLSLTFSAVVPFFHFQYQIPVSSVLLPEVQVGTGYYLLDTITVFGNSTTSYLLQFIKNLPWLKLLYVIGYLILIIKLVFSLIRIQMFQHKATIVKHDNYYLVETGDKTSPFSFFNLMFINRNQYDADEFDMIVNHELSHIRLKHSYDILLLELVLIIQWFNPFAWLLRRDLKELHEFQADQATLTAGIDPVHYRKLLVFQTVGTRFDFAHNFSQSLIKKRLNMMNLSIKRSPGLLKPFAVILLMGVLTLVFGYDLIQAQSEKTVESESTQPVLTAENTNVPEPIKDEQVDNKNIEKKSELSSDSIYENVDVMPEYPGGTSELMNYISSSVRYPIECMEDTIQGKVIIGFIVDKQGYVKDAQVTKSAHTLLDAEALRVISSMPQWKPGQMKGKNVKVHYTIPVKFALTKPEETPSFPGGRTAMHKFMYDNFKYPDNFKRDSITKVVYIQFKVDAIGKIKDVKLERGVNELIDAEALRVIKSMPEWIPAKKNGVAIEASVTLPFGLQETPVFPEFKGGNDALNLFIQSNIKYPEQCKKDSIQGTVYIEFGIDKTGQVKNSVVLRGVNKLLDEEALRVINAMPIWIPGSFKGEKVSIMLTLPIQFKL